MHVQITCHAITQGSNHGFLRDLRTESSSVFLVLEFSQSVLYAIRLCRSWDQRLTFLSRVVLEGA
jgi:hypothetical protein